VSEFRLALRLGHGTLRSRPTLTLLGIVLLALGSFLMGGMTGTVYLLKGIQAEFLTALTVEIELTDQSESLRTRIYERTEIWPGAEFVQYVSPEATLREVEREMNEDVAELFGTNPFPPIIRVRFGETTLPTLDSLTREAESWAGVAGVIYPRQLWNRLEELMRSIQGSSGISAVALGIIAIILLGLCLRAQIRYRAGTWELVGLLGMSERTMGIALLVQEVVIGICGGLVACGMLYLLTVVLGWLLLHNVLLPTWYYGSVWLGSIALSVLAGALSPRGFDE